MDIKQTIIRFLGWATLVLIYLVIAFSAGAALYRQYPHGITHMSVLFTVFGAIVMVASLVSFMNALVWQKKLGGTNVPYWLGGPTSYLASAIGLGLLLAAQHAVK